MKIKTLRERERAKGKERERERELGNSPSCWVKWRIWNWPAKCLLTPKPALRHGGWSASGVHLVFVTSHCETKTMRSQDEVEVDGNRTGLCNRGMVWLYSSRVYIAQYWTLLIARELRKRHMCLSCLPWSPVPLCVSGPCHVPEVPQGQMLQWLCLFSQYMELHICEN